MPLCGQKDKDIGKKSFSKYFWLEEIRVLKKWKGKKPIGEILRKLE